MLHACQSSNVLTVRECQSAVMKDQCGWTCGSLLVKEWDDSEVDGTEGKTSWHCGITTQYGSVVGQRDWRVSASEVGPWKVWHQQPRRRTGDINRLPTSCLNSARNALLLYSLLSLCFHDSSLFLCFHYSYTIIRIVILIMTAARRAIKSFVKARVNVVVVRRQFTSFVLRLTLFAFRFRFVTFKFFQKCRSRSKRWDFDDSRSVTEN